jgi:uncharacterized protein (DUF1800 family)
VPVYDGHFGPRQAERLLWRAGFGPAPGHAEALSKFGVEGAVRSLTRPQVPERLTGPEPKGAGGVPLQPLEIDGHDHLWWLDRMVRTNRPFIERMTLVWHDWFATSNAAVVNDKRLMRAQNQMFREAGLGSFDRLLSNIASDGAMLRWLNGVKNRGGKPDENYARESMELFSLGADRGAYTEQDVREMARAHTGWVATFTEGFGWHDFRVEPRLHDKGEKTIFGQRGNFDWRDASRLCVEHPMHPSYLVDKLWGYFIPTPPDESTRRAMEEAYEAGSHELLPLFEAILMHPDLYRGEHMVKPPVVYTAGLLRARRAGVVDEMLTWCEIAGQRLFYPPNVDGWPADAWLDTTTIRARWLLVYHIITGSLVHPNSVQGSSYDPTETPEQAVVRALEFWGNPALSEASWACLVDWASTCLPIVGDAVEASKARAGRQNALRYLIGAAPDLQVC